MTGQGLICSLKNLSKIENSDNLLKAELFGETIIISKDYYEGKLGILYDVETQLSKKYAHENNLFRHSNLNKDITKKGYLDDNCRIKPIRLRGVKCSALFMPIESLSYISKDNYPKEGTQINEWMGHKICEKYMRPIKQHQGKQSKIKKVQQVLFFPEVGDTDQLLRNLHKIHSYNNIIITEKLHGTSCRAGLVPCSPRNWFKKLWQKIFNTKNKYKFVVGSRHVLKHCEGDKLDKKDSFYKDDIWTESAYKYFYGKLIPGEIIYYEIVGFLPSGTPIMPSHNNEKLKNFLEKDEYNKFIEKFGKETIFHYGCKSYLDLEGPKGNYKIFVYRITMSNEFGHTINLSWGQLKRRCEELGVHHVPEIDQFWADPDRDFYLDDNFWIEQTEQDSRFFPTHLNEGIVVRIENGELQPLVYKNKRYTFKVLEGIIKDSQEFADIEESN